MKLKDLSKQSWLNRWLVAMFVFFNFSAATYAQQNMSGTVSDENGESIVGVNVIVKNRTSVGTITDLDGNFTVPVLPNDVLVFSYIGYITQEVSIAGKQQLKIILKESTLDLNELVVIGYGTQRKGDVTSSVASVKPENFVKGAVKDMGQLMQGKIAGLAITNASGDPTSQTTFKLRGNNTLSGANTDPLVLIDGIPGDINTMAPEDVESIDVLKDGSAAAIYGTRGTNGVILITTKKVHGTDINNVEYNGYVSTAQVARKLEFVSADEFRNLYPEFDHGSNVDWLDEITRTPVSHLHNLSLQGGNTRTNYVANINYNAQQGIMLKSDNETFQGRVEITHRMFNDKLQLRFGIFGKQNIYASTGSGGSFRTRAYWQALRRNPTDPIYNEDNSWFENTNKLDYENPLALLKEATGGVKNTQTRYNGNITYNPNQDLTFNALVSYDRRNRNAGYSESMNHISALRDGYAGWSSVSGYTRMEKLAEITAQYKKQINKHNFSILGGYSYMENDYENYELTNYGFQDDSFGGWHNIGIGAAKKEGLSGSSSSKTISNLIGFFGRATYAYDDRYLLMASLRREGASQLWGTNNAWGTFPSISVGWRITQESFMQKQTIFNDLKLRAGYGVTGSQPSSAFLGVAMLKYENYAYVNGAWIQTIVPASNANPDLKWEEKKETNVGIDFSSLGGRLSGSIDVYNRTVDGLLYEYQVSVPPQFISNNHGEWRNAPK